MVQRPPDRVYPVVFIDAIHVKIRDVELNLLLGSAVSMNPTASEPDSHRSEHRSAFVTGVRPADRDALLRAPNERLRWSASRDLVRCSDSPLSRTVVQCSGERVSVTVEGAWQETDSSELMIIVAGAEAADADLRSVTDRLDEVLAE